MPENLEHQSVKVEKGVGEIPASPTEAKQKGAEVLDNAKSTIKEAQDVKEMEKVAKEMDAKGLKVNLNSQGKIERFQPTGVSMSDIVLGRSGVSQADRTRILKEGFRDNYSADKGGYFDNFVFEGDKIKFEEMKGDNSRAYSVELIKIDGGYLVSEDGKDACKILLKPENGFPGEKKYDKNLLYKPVDEEVPSIFKQKTDKPKENVAKDKVEYSEEATKKLRDLGFSVHGKTLSVDGLGKEADLVFDDNTKNVACSVGPESVILKIENKDGTNDIMDISQESIKYNGKEMALDDRGRVLRDLRWVEQVNAGEGIDERIKFRPYLSGTSESGLRVEVKEVDYEAMRRTGVEFDDYKQSFEVTFDGKPVKVLEADRLRDGGTTNIVVAFPLEIAGKSMSVRRRIHIPAFRKGDADIDGEKIKS